jgi:hypothetical protein
MYRMVLCNYCGRSKCVSIENFVIFFLYVYHWTIHFISSWCAIPLYSLHTGFLGNYVIWEKLWPSILLTKYKVYATKNYTIGKFFWIWIQWYNFYVIYFIFFWPKLMVKFFLEVCNCPIIRYGGSISSKIL